MGGPKWKNTPQIGDAFRVIIKKKVYFSSQTL